MQWWSKCPQMPQCINYTGHLNTLTHTHTPNIFAIIHNKPFSSSTRFDFHMFFLPSLVSCRFVGLRGAPAFHYSGRHFSAYTSDRVCARSGGQHAVGMTPWPLRAADTNLTTPTQTNCHDRSPPPSGQLLPETTPCAAVTRDLQ